MKRFTKVLPISSIILGVSSMALVTPALAETEFRAPFFSKSFLGQELRASGISEGILLDDDLIRGNNAGEAVIQLSTNPINTNPFQFFQADSSERLMTVTFEDGSVVEGISGLFDSAFFNFGTSVQYFLVSKEELAALGYNHSEIVDVVPGEIVELSLNWSDYGFSEFQLPPPDPAPTEDDIIFGTDANDRLVGTDGVDIFLSGGGSRDRMTGGEGGDFFVVGAEVDDGIKNRDVILDFEPSRDVLVIERNARMRSVRVRNGNFVIQFQGSDRDTVVFRNSTIINATQFEIIFINGEFDILDIQPD
ncbi:hypothetical protein [Glaciecola sp. 1036]|uniref:hypothetical protein n=1 Tax=Alteromonadaceae TaxID=72275 RepID=UPI003CFEEE9A